MTAAEAPPPEDSSPSPQTQAGIHRRLVQGFAGKAIGTAIIFGEQILLVPIFLLFWSPTVYGDWLVLLSTAGFIGLLDLGLNAYYSNALQQTLARGERENFLVLVRQGGFIYATIFVIGIVVVFLAAHSVSWPSLLNLKSISDLTAVQILCLLAGYFLLMIPFGFINSIYRAYGEFVVSVMVMNLQRIGLITIIIAVLAIGAPATYLALVYFVIACLAWVIVLCHQKRRYPDLKFGISLPDRKGFRAAFSIGPAYAVVPAAMALTIHGTILLISALASSGATIAAYNTIRTLTGFAKHVTAEFMQVLGVEGARQYAQEDWDALSRLYRFVSRVTGCCCGFLGGLIAIIGPPFFSIWTLGKLSFTGEIFWPLLGSTVFAGPSLAGVAILYFINKPRGMVTAHVASGVAVTVLCLILIPQLGAAGAAWAVFFAEVFMLSVIIPFFAAKIVRENPFRQIFLGQIFAVSAFVLSGAAAWLAIKIVGEESLIFLIFAGLLWVILISPAVYFLAFRESERNWIHSRLKNLLGRG